MTSPRKPLAYLGFAFYLAATFWLPQRILAQTPPAQPEIGGIGIQSKTDEKARQLVIQEVTPGGPAARAGLKAGDIVLEVDGKTVAGESQVQIISRVRGVIGT
ncbi:MAG: PDZ domain-containing protein, partial [Anaerolineae bacterium]|nr:PDZ domain-containing protein [Gloeobacterales cyanobacterium ES-bin-313]